MQNDTFFAILKNIANIFFCFCTSYFGPYAPNLVDYFGSIFHVNFQSEMQNTKMYKNPHPTQCPDYGIFSSGLRKWVSTTGPLHNRPCFCLLCKGPDINREHFIVDMRFLNTTGLARHCVWACWPTRLTASERNATSNFWGPFRSTHLPASLFDVHVGQPV